MNKDDLRAQLEEVINLKYVLFKIFQQWKWILLLVLLGIFLAYEYNLRKPDIYELNTVISVKDKQNPFFTNNMSLVFNWGGPSDKVNTIITTFKSRTHNEDIVKKLRYYIKYYVQGKYYPVDIYGKSPFTVVPDSGAYQAVGIPFAVKFKTPETFVLSYKIKDPSVKVFNYDTEKAKNIRLPSLKFSKTYRIGEAVDEPFFHGKILRNNEVKPGINKTYFFRFDDFNATVNHYKNLFVGPYKKNSSMIVLKLKGQNKKKIEKYLNESVRILGQKLLADKNSFATNTLRFIDSSLVLLKKDLEESGRKLQEFQKGKAEFALDNPSEEIYNRLIDLDRQKEMIRSKEMYYQSLLNFLDNNQLEKIPSPSVVGIDDQLIIANTGKLVQLSIRKKQLEATQNPNSYLIRQIDNEIESLKSALRNAVHAALRNLNGQKSLLQAQINKLAAKLNALPLQLKNFIDLKRDYTIKDEIYSYLLQKRNEVNIVKASNQSTIKVIDSAKDTGQPPVAPNRKINYLIAVMLAVLLPVLFIVIRVSGDTTIHDESDIKRTLPIRIIGTIFHSSTKTMLPTLEEKAGTRIRESFSTLRTNLRMQLPVRPGGKVILITSTTSAEGKTFISSNLGTITAQSHQKTVIMELDVRKPKSHKYFNFDKRAKGLSDFLLDESVNVEDIIHPTQIKNLYFIPAGKAIDEYKEDIAGLLEDERVKSLFEQLRKQFDFVIVDSPPLGLVPDSLILYQYSDFMGYVVRENYTKRPYLNLIKDYYENGEIDKVGLIYNDYHIDLIKRHAYKSKYTYAYSKYGYKTYDGTKATRLFPEWLKKLFRFRYDRER